MEETIGFVDEDGEVHIHSLDQSALEQGFRLVFDAASDELKKEVVLNFVAILREESEQKRLNYERSFFRASDLKYATLEDRKTIKNHLFLVLSTHPESILPTLNGIGEFLEDDIERSKFVDGVMQTVYAGETQSVIECIKGEVDNADTDARTFFISRVLDWVNQFKQSRRYYSAACELTKVIGVSTSQQEEVGDEDELPF